MKRLYAFCSLMLSFLLSGCSLPPPQGRSASQALNATETTSTPLGQGVQMLRQQAGATPNLTGFYPIRDAHEAFAARALLARGAQRSLDV